MIRRITPPERPESAELLARNDRLLHLLDDHLDPTIKIVADGGLEGVNGVHGAAARWMEWHGQLDTTLNRVIIRFENNAGPLNWFVRRNYPLAALPVQFDRNREIAAGADLLIDHTLTFTAQS